MSLRTSLTHSKAPYLVTILVGAIGWGTVHVIDEVHAAPSVEYDISHEQSGKIVVTIENLSSVHRFKDLNFEFDVRGANTGRFTNSIIEAVPPAFEGDVPAGTISESGQSVKFSLPDLQPRARVLLRADYSGNGQPTFRLLKGESDIELLEKSCFTFIVKHELGVVLSLGLVAVPIILAILALAV